MTFVEQNGVMVNGSGADVGKAAWGLVAFKAYIPLLSASIATEWNKGSRHLGLPTVMGLTVPLTLDTSREVPPCHGSNSLFSVA